MDTDLIDDVLASDLVDDPSRSPAREPRAAAITAHRRRRWAGEAALAAAALGGFGSFLTLARAIRGKQSHAFDRAVVRLVGRARGRLGTVIARAVTFFGSAPGAAGVSITALTMTLMRRRRRLAAQIVVGALGGISAELGVKRIFRRKRPTLLRHLEEVTSTSFPSGHSMAAASLYLTLAFVASRSRRFRARRAAMLARGAGLATSVGASRVYLGVHWPTDVLGGLALGTAWACIAEAAFDRIGADRIEREAFGGHA